MSSQRPDGFAERGMVLITSLLLLIVVTILALAMFRGFGLDEKIAGNVREKHRALNAAETAEQYAEWWLSNGNAGTPVNCNTLVGAAAGQVCSNVMTNAAAVPLPWTAGVTYVPVSADPTLAMDAPGPQNAYYQTPTFYISYLGPSPTALPGVIYQIDAAGFSGSSDTVAVVESTYLVQQNSSCLSCTQ